MLRVGSEYVQSRFRVGSEQVRSRFRAGSEQVRSMKENVIFLSSSSSGYTSQYKRLWTLTQDVQPGHSHTGEGSVILKRGFKRL